MSRNVLFCPEPKDIMCSVIEEERKQKIITFKRLESENLDYFPLIFLIFSDIATTSKGTFMFRPKNPLQN